ncbi:UBC-like protein [Rickenella mellea]|uniref:UBC-like protein n=1 Tax=Rickenella mellea TaxID=50990 RepID=A0A4Y7QKU6_9AGAM|nr:UBC-like protein [Rickenella mellea]
MATRSSHNKNNSAIKRIMQEARELAEDPSTDYSAAPLEDDLFEWHCTIRGPAGTEFEGGVYHFRIILPAEYPFRPPSIMMLTPNGRFELNTKICISFTNYHEELWQPAWGVRTAIVGLQGFFPLKGQAAVGVGAIETPVSERKRLAKLSREWVCPHCKLSNLECLPDPLVVEPATDGSADSSDTTNSQGNEKSPQQNGSPPSASSQAVVPPTVDVHSVPLARESVVRIDTTQEEKLPPAMPNSQSRHRVVETPRPHTEHSLIPNATRTSSRSPPRPPVLLDAAICVLLILVIALLCRKVF